MRFSPSNSNVRSGLYWTLGSVPDQSYYYHPGVSTKPGARNALTDIDPAVDQSSRPGLRL